MAVSAARSSGSMGLPARFCVVRCNHPGNSQNDAIPASLWSSSGSRRMLPSEVRPALLHTEVAPTSGTYTRVLLSGFQFMPPGPLGSAIPGVYTNTRSSETLDSTGCGQTQPKGFLHSRTKADTPENRADVQAKVLYLPFLVQMSRK